MDAGTRQYRGKSSIPAAKHLMLLMLSLVNAGLFAADSEHAQIMADLEQNAIVKACHNEIEHFCSNDPNQSACLKKLHDVPQSNFLGACCTAKLHEAEIASGQQVINYFAGVQIPAGSKLAFDFFCETATIETIAPTHYKSMEIAAGPLVFGGLGNLKLARLSGQQAVQGLLLDKEQPFTQLFDNGVPKQVQLSSVSEQNGIKFKAVEKLDRYKSSWSNVPTDVLYQLAIGSERVFGLNHTQLHENGRVALGNIAVAVVVNGLPMAPGRTEFNEHGDVVSGNLSQTHSYNGLLLGAGQITFRNNGQLDKAVLAAGATLNGLQLNVASTISMNQDSKPERLELGRTGEISNERISTKLGPFWQVTGEKIKLYPNGQVKELITANHSWYKGKIYPTGTKIKFEQHGDIIWNSFYDEVLVQPIAHKRQRYNIPEILPTAEVRNGRLIPKGSLVYPYYPDGQSRVIVPYPFEYHGLRLAAGEFLLDAEGNIREAYLEKDSMHYDAMLKAYPKKIHLSQTGDITAATLANTAVIDGIEYANNFQMLFTPSGKVLMGWPATDTTIDGRIYKSRKRLTFDNSGQLLEGVLAQNTPIGSILIPAESSFSFHSDQSIYINSKVAIIVDEVEYAGSNLALYKDGSIKSGELTQAALINGEFESAGTKLDFYSNGEIRYRMERSTRDTQLFQARNNATVFVGKQELEPVAPMSLNQCQHFIASSKQSRRVWLTNNSGWSLGSANFYQECLDTIAANADQ